MKYQQHPFATIRRIAPLWVLAALLLGSCSKDADLMDGHNNPRPSAPLIIRSTIAAFTPLNDGAQTRIPVEDGTTTRFQADDAMGSLPLPASATRPPPLPPASTTLVLPTPPLLPATPLPPAPSVRGRLPPAPTSPTTPVSPT